MGRLLAVIALIFAGFLLPLESLAQAPAEKEGSEHRGGRGMMGPRHPHMMDWANRLNLTPEQSASLQELRGAYLRDTLPWRDQLVVKRYELRSLLRRPETEPQTVLDKQKEVLDLEARIQERALVHILEMRKILTPEQLKLLPPHWGGHHGPFRVPGRGPGMGKEN